MKLKASRNVEKYKDTDKEMEIEIPENYDAVSLEDISKQQKQEWEKKDIISLRRLEKNEK